MPGKVSEASKAAKIATINSMLSTMARIRDDYPAIR